MLKLLEKFCEENSELEQLQSRAFVAALQKETILQQLDDARRFSYELARENADLKYRVTFLECRLKEYQDSNPVNSYGLDLNFSSISDFNVAFEPSYDIYGTDSGEEKMHQKQTKKVKLLPPQPLPQNVGKTRSQRKNMKRKLKKKMQVENDNGEDE